MPLTFANFIEFIKTVGEIGTPVLILYVTKKLIKVEDKVVVTDLHTREAKEKLSEIHVQSNSARADTLRVIMLLSKQLAEAKPSDAADRMALESEIAYINHQTSEAAFKAGVESGKAQLVS